jgi:hypothetical protein
MAYSHLEQRALSAYFRKDSGGGSLDQPGAVDTVEHKGLRYVRLANVNGILAVYRVRVVNGDEVLKGLRRWPRELEVY